ncbi:MAG: hypothetical protein PSX81_15960 [bacterium]|nr:hypothetical protein [bacterium]
MNFINRKLNNIAKQALILLCLMHTSSLFSQLQPVLKNKRGIAILPQQGDFAIGFGANPFLNYFGNFFNGNNNNISPSPTFATPNQSLFFKYMKTNQLAYRGYFRIGVNSNTLNFNVADKTPGAASGSLVKDVQKTKNNIIGIGFGIEKRRGTTRVQGYYGGEVYFNYNSGFDTKFKYGNSIENEDTGVIRNTIINASSSLTFGVRGFVGVEYFIAPRVSLGGELGYGPSINVRSANEITSESYDKTTSTLTARKISTSSKSTGFSMDTDNYFGIVKLLFYF